jgi:hypothetical protein
MAAKIWVMSFLSLVLACGGSGNIPVSNPDTVHHNDGTSSLPPTYTPPTGEAVVCDTVLDSTDGHTYPFQGLTSHGKTITCTACPTGFNKLNDEWLWFAEDEDGNLTLDLKAAGYDMTSDELTFNGNTFVEVITGVDSGSGQQVTQRIEGYFVCPTPEEMPSLQFIWVITKADPEGAFGNKAGDSYPYAQLDSTAGVNDMMLWFDYDWSGSPAPFQQAKYCRRGESFSGVMCEIP